MIAPTNRTQQRQGGFALILAIFLVAFFIIMAAVVAPNIVTQGRRERETETIWRGQQYVRGIRLYFQKTGHYPPTIEDLTKNINGIYVMRKAYTDPMNRTDGAWRPIYVTPSGALVGSLRYTSLQQMAFLERGGVAGSGPQTGLPGNQPGGAQGTIGNPPNPSPGPAPNPPTNPAGPQNNSSTSQQETAQGSTGQAQSPPVPAQPQQDTSATSSDEPQPLEPGSGPVIGASLIGVGGTVNMPSVKFYKGGKKYKQWEFIYNPMLQALNALQTSNPGANPTGQQGQNPSQPAAPTSPTPPPQPSPQSPMQ